MSSEIRSLQIVGDGSTSTVALVRHLLKGARSWRGRHVEVMDELSLSPAAAAGLGDVLLLVRYADPTGYPEIASLIERNIPYAYLIDDNFWLLLDASPLSSFYKNWSVRKTLESAISGARVVLCHSQKFRKFLLLYNPNVVVVPAFFDSSCIQGIAPAEGVKERRIGVVGNPSKASDMEIIVPAILSVADRTEADVFFEFFGYVPPILEGHPKVRSFNSISDYVTFLRTKYSRNWITALAPLQESRFSSYKSNNKFREFGGCGIAGIYSDVEVYRESVSHGKTGWLVPNDPQAWSAQIEAVLGDPSGARKVGASARQYVEQNYSIEHVRDLWVDAIWSAASARRRLEFFTKLFRRGDAPKDAGTPPSLYIGSKNGAESDRPAMRRPGFYRGEVLLNVEPGDAIDTQLIAPVSGEFHWSVLVATFMRACTGRLVIQVLSNNLPVHRLEIEGAKIGDNQSISIDLCLEEGQLLTVTVTNDLSEAIGLYLLSPNGTTRYASTGRSYAGRFVA